jgi:hypothetical protein
MLTSIDTEVYAYERMVERYNAALFNTLRHHQTSDDLDTWVPDDDPLRSILNMVEAAEIAGRASLAVRVGPVTAERLDLDDLRRQLTPLGTVAIEPDGDGTIIRVDAIGGRAGAAAPARSADVFAAVGPAYRDGVRAAAGAIAHEGTLDLPFGATAYAVALDGVTLEVAADEAHTIRAAAHRGTATRADRAVMDAFCGILAGLSMQEAHDHAAIRLEYALRDPDARRPVGGIVRPENADPVFVRPARLIRDLVARYRDTTGFRLGENRFMPRPSPAWLALDREARLAMLDAAVDEAAPGLGLAAGDVRIVDLETPIKAIVAFGDGVAVAAKPHLLMQLERRLHALEATLQLYSVEFKDLNKTRRL